MRRQTQTVHPFRSFISSFPTQQDCVLPVVRFQEGPGDEVALVADLVACSHSRPQRPRSFWSAPRGPKGAKKKGTKWSAASGDENGPARSSELYSWVARDIIIDPPKLLSLSGMRRDKFMCV